MSEDRRRTLERAALAGDPEARERLVHMEQRYGNGRHADKIGKEVLFVGVRDHYCGTLLRVTELGAGRAILHVAPCVWLNSLASTDGSKRVPATKENPLDLSSEGVLGVCLRPDNF